MAKSQNFESPEGLSHRLLLAAGGPPSSPAPTPRRPAPWGPAPPRAARRAAPAELPVSENWGENRGGILPWENDGEKLRAD